MTLEKQQYVKEVGISHNTYRNLYLTKERIGKIAGTFKRVLHGRKWLDNDLKEKEVENLKSYVAENLVVPIIENSQMWQNEFEYSGWHNNVVSQVIGNCPMTWKNGNCLTIGMAQKIVNLFTKDLWALELLPPEYEAFLHVVLDKIVLNEIEKDEPLYLRTSWTQIDDYLTYQNLQRKFLDYMKKQNMAEGKQYSPIELENIIWLRNARMI